MTPRLRIWGLAFLASALAAWPGTAASPLALHPDNPHYFRFRGKPTVLITSGEHYGAVLNLDFDYEGYLDTLAGHGFNLTRTFSGTYREVPGSFGIRENTLAPAPGRFACPWARTAVPGARDGGTLFDLDQWDPAYFTRLKDFVASAGRRGIVVEMVLFCTMYDDRLWAASPLHSGNNLNRIGRVDRQEVYAFKDPQLVAAQAAVVRQLVTELNPFDNVYYEICNEPYERGGFSREWNDRMVSVIVKTEAALPNQHLIAQGIAVRSARITEPNPRVSVFNFHAAQPRGVELNYHLNRPIADDETGGKGVHAAPYRREAWQFLLAGGSVFSHLDFSFTCRHPDGTWALTDEPGGGGLELRRQLQVLKRFLEGLDFVRMKPDRTSVVAHRRLGEGPGNRAPSPAHQALSQPGRAYAIYLHGGPQSELTLALPAGAYLAEWTSPQSGRVEAADRFEHPGAQKTLRSPPYHPDIALRLTRVPNR